MKFIKKSIWFLEDIVRGALMKARWVWWVLRYGSKEKIPVKVIADSLVKDIAYFEKNAKEAEKIMPELYKDILRYGDEEHLARIKEMIMFSSKNMEKLDKLKKRTDTILHRMRENQ